MIDDDDDDGGQRPSKRAHPSKISFSWRTHESQANHIMVRSWSTSSFHAIDWFCSRNSRVSTSHPSMFSGLAKSHATLMQSARLHTCRETASAGLRTTTTMHTHAHMRACARMHVQK